MTPPSKKPDAFADDDPSGVYKGFYEHSTGGKVPRIDPKPAARPPEKPSRISRAKAAISRAVRSALGKRSR